MTSPDDKPVVVGVDGSPTSTSALEWALGAAVRHARPLKLVHALQIAGPFLVTDPIPDSHEATQASEILAHATGYLHAAGVSPSMRIRTEILHDAPAHALIKESGNAAMIVVGSRGHGGFRDLLLGSVSLQTATHAHCPVVVVRPRVAPDGDEHHAVGRVLVGVDGSNLSTAAIGFAFEEASLRAVGLTALHAWQPPVVAGEEAFAPVAAQQQDLSELRDTQAALLTRSIEPWRTRYPHVDIRELTVQSTASHALIHESAGAELLVVGSRGRGGFAGLLLGSVSHAALHHARCPVAVART